MFGSNLLTGWLPGRWPHLNEKKTYLFTLEKIIEKKIVPLGFKGVTGKQSLTKWANDIVSTALIRKEQGK